MSARVVFLLAIQIMLAACSPEFDQATSSTSPDGKFTIDVTREIQPANDPDVYWQHISLRAATSAKGGGRGNMAVYSCSSEPTITWRSSTDVVLMINKDDVGESFRNAPPAKTLDGVTVSFELH